MTTKVRTVSPDMSLRELVAFFLDNKVSSAPVVDGGMRLLGFISERDCLSAIANESFFGSSVIQNAANIMRKHPTTVPPGMELFRLASMFIHRGYRHLPVTTDEQLIGIVSRSDVLRAVSDFWQVPGEPEQRDNRIN